MRDKTNLRLNFYGDDTWLSLYPPSTFGASQGVSSFFATETVIVDKIVTDAMLPLLLDKRNTWDVMILHYLGLDHVGHSVGPASPRMIEKQHEMDDIIAMLQATVDVPIVVLGDHGMTDGGNHGGSSPHELASALLVLYPNGSDLPSRSYDFFPTNYWDTHDSKSSPFQMVDQLQVASTMSALFGIPIPKNNLGHIIADLLPEDKRLFWQRANAKQIYDLLFNFSGKPEVNLENSCKEEVSDDFACLAKVYRNVSDSNFGLEKFISRASEVLSRSFRSYNMSYMISGFVLLLAAVVWTHTSNSWDCHLLMKLAYGINGLAMFASSFVEEEHQIYYYWTATALSIVTWLRLRSGAWNKRQLLTAWGLFAIARKWNQTGQKWAHLTDIRHFIAVEHPPICAALLFAGIFIIGFQISKANRTASSQVITWVCLAFTGTYQASIDLGLLDLTYLVECARTVYLLTGLHLLIEHNIQSAGTLALTILIRAHNVPLLAMLSVTSSMISGDKAEMPLSYFLSGASFFLLGNSNSLSTIDISHSYTGLRDFSVVWTGLLTLLANWAGPLMLGSHYLPSRVWVSACTAAALLLLRDHLFIWSVFCPRLAYEFAWFAIQAAHSVSKIILRTRGKRRES